MEKRAFPWLALVTGVAAAFLAASTVRDSERRLADSRFRQGTEAAVNALQGGIDRNVEILETFAAFYAHGDVSRAEFRRFAARLLQSHGDIQALEWIPRVTAEQRIDHEARARREGFPDFLITERLAQGRMVAAAPRTEYFPVYFVEPPKGNEIAAGFDLASNSVRREALETSRDSGAMVATARITLVQEKASQAGFLIFQPIYRADAPLTAVDERRRALRGFALGVFRIGDMADYVLRNVSAADATLSLRDLDAPAGEEPLYRRAPSGTSANEVRAGDHRVDLPLRVPGRHWSVHLESTPAFDASHGMGPAWSTLAAGLVLTGVLVAFLRSLSYRAAEQQEHAAALGDANRRLQAEVGGHQRAEAALRESEEQFRQAFQNAAIGMALVALDGRWLKVNDALCRIVGYSAPELLSRTFQDITHPDDIEADLGNVHRLLAGEIGSYHMEKRYLRKDGDIVWIRLSASLVRDVGGAPNHFVAQIEDITERKRKETELRLFRTLLDNSSDAVEILDPTTLRFLDVNAKQCADLGYSREELLGMRVADIDPNVGPEMGKAIEEQLQRTGAARFEAIHRRRDGSTLPVEISARLVELDRPYLLNIVRDISERKRAEQEARTYVEDLTRANAELKTLNAKLEQAQSQLLQSEKMASIGMLAAGVAHEINNPVGFVKSNMQSLGRYVEDLLRVVNAYEKAEALLPQHQATFVELHRLEEQIEFEYEKQDVLALLSESRQGLERVTKIVQDLKEFSHMETQDQWIADDIHKGIESTLTVIWNELKYTCEVKKEYGLLPPVECLLPQLNQVFMNLLVNAAQAIETKGTITIRTGTEGDTVWIEIADTGKGIAPENLNRIFDPFYTTKPVGKGTGLGLSVSYSIVQKHRGRIDVDSAVGKGTKFCVWLPVRQPPPGGDSVAV